MDLIKKYNLILYFLFTILLNITSELFCDKNKYCSNCTICGKDNNSYCSCDFDNILCKNDNNDKNAILSDFLFSYDACPDKKIESYDICGDPDINLEIGLNKSIKFSECNEDNILCYYNLKKTNNNNNNLHINIKGIGGKSMNLSLYLVYYLNNTERKLITITNILDKSNFFNIIIDPDVERVSVYASFQNIGKIDNISFDFYVETNSVTKIIHKINSKEKTKLIYLITIIIAGIAIITSVIIILFKKWKHNKKEKENDNNKTKKMNTTIDIKKINCEKMKKLYDNELSPKIYYKKDVINECYKCTICLEDFKEGLSMVLTTKCGHKFHFNCFKKYIEKNIFFPKCPNCVTPILEIDNKYLKNYGSDTNPSSIFASNTQLAPNTNNNNTNTTIKTNETSII